MSEKVKKRINVYISPDLDRKIDDYAKKFSVTKSTLVTMSVQAGLDAIIRALAPQDAITPEIMASLISEMDKRGVKFEKPEESTTEEK